MLTSLTDEGRKNTDEDPDTLNEINREVEYLGVKILAQYALLGQYDFISILEASSNEAVARLATRLSGKGTMQTLTMAAMKVEDLISALKKKDTPW
jgi:uncharacterized protein with GYD domain